VVRETSPVVLVVEDDSAVRQPLVKFLQMRQYTVVRVPKILTKSFPKILTRCR
jgi:DNA-binding response OmpR family regulator